MFADWNRVLGGVPKVRMVLAISGVLNNQGVKAVGFGSLTVPGHRCFRKHEIVSILALTMLRMRLDSGNIFG